MTYHPTILTHEDVLTRAEKEREREELYEAIDDMRRLEDEFEDVIHGAEQLARDGWADMAEVLKKAREAKAIVEKRRQIVERMTP